MRHGSLLTFWRFTNRIIIIIIIMLIKWIKTTLSLIFYVIYTFVKFVCAILYSTSIHYNVYWTI